MYQFAVSTNWLISFCLLSLRLGRPGVDVHLSHVPAFSITQLQFIVNEVSLIYFCKSILYHYHYLLSLNCLQSCWCSHVQKGLYIWLYICCIFDEFSWKNQQFRSESHFQVTKIAFSVTHKCEKNARVKTSSRRLTLWREHWKRSQKRSHTGNNNDIKIHLLRLSFSRLPG